MSDFIEIFGESKASLNKNLGVRVCLEDPKHLNEETQLQHDINQEAQFYAEKLASTTFNVYGSVAPNLNLKLKGSDKPNYDYFKFTSDNWQLVLLKATNFHGERGKKKFLKENIHEYDFNYGLPCLKVIPKQEELKNYMAFNCYFGHNFKTDDRVYITSLDPLYIKSGYYSVIGVDGNSVSINNEYVEVIPDYDDVEFTTAVSIDEQVAKLKTVETTSPLLKPPVFDSETTGLDDVSTRIGGNFFRRSKTVVTEVRSKIISAVGINAAAPNVTSVANNDELLQLKNIEIGLLNDSVLAEIKLKRPNISKILKPKYFIKKVKEDYDLEYYMKQVEVIGVVNEFNDCAFSLSSTGEQVINYTFSDIDIKSMVDNHGIPVTEFVVGLIKKSGNANVTLSNVESNFKKLINYTDTDHGLETIMDKHDQNEIDELKVGDKMFIGLCEFDKENLSETVVTNLHHRVIHLDVSFTYNPFYTLPIKSFSSYIEDSNTKSNIPDYAMYSDLKQKYIWRDIHDIGFFESDGVGIDHKFLNGCFYVYKRINFILDNSFTIKYRYNQNDINKLNDLDSEIDSVRDILTDLIDDPDAATTDTQGYQEFKSKQC